MRRDPRVGFVVESGSGGSIACIIVQGSSKWRFFPANLTAAGSAPGSSTSTVSTWRNAGMDVRYPNRERFF